MASSQCCENPPTLNPSAGAGSVLEDFGGLRGYVTGDPESNRAVILASDVFGFESPNLRKIADKVAASGFFVVVPDLIYGDPYVPDDAERPIPVWLQAHAPDKGAEDAKSVIAALKSKGITSVGAAGFCWGAKVVVELAKSAEIQACVLLHPSFVSVDDMKEIKCPIAILGAEFDHLSPPQLVKQYEEILSQISGIDSFVKIFPRVAHGWTVRWTVDDDFAIKSAEEAHKDMLDWFLKHIK
ncbi:putative dienelactone hydrolase, alpha/Beta hydrolase [Dioscorea sansibarensis]